ncbi:urease accessory protein UreF [Dongia deserti]|uniref:urease accessory protein UreF n=1 Tax=Dongia deserti TaxID=2268030 RepID=UPI002547AAD3|nr:urease accessory UreF family protein [Dongia deserti]
MSLWRPGTIMDTIERSASAAEAAARLLTWLSPAFPVGSFSYSHGLEYAVEAGLASDRSALLTWIEGILRHGAGRLDGMLLLEAHRAATAADLDRLAEAAELAAAMRGSAELALESTAQGTAFLKAIGRGWPHLADAPALRTLARSTRVVYPVAVGATAALAGIAEATVLQAYLAAFCGNFVSAALRLAPIGQSDGIAVLAALEPAISIQVECLGVTQFERLGSASLMVDWCSMKHETQDTRLFRS